MARTTRSLLEIMDRSIGDDPALRALIAKERVNARVAQLIRMTREEEGLTQRELAALVGTSQSVIARLESGLYQGHSLNQFARVMAALGRSIEVSVSPAREAKALKSGRRSQRPAAAPRP